MKSSPTHATLRDHSARCRKKHLYIVTGGPGSGKTTTLLELERRGYSVVPEVARQVIQEQVTRGGSALPWADRRSFADAMLERSIASFHAQEATSVTFCDRGIPDTLCYLRLIGVQSIEAQLACDRFRYASVAFIAPAWEAIYKMDSERRQNFQEAQRTYEMMAETYRDCGYRLVELPLATPMDRADFILETLWHARQGHLL